MIVDPSALAAIIFDEEGGEHLLNALLDEQAGIPAPALTEFDRVASLRGPGFSQIASELLDQLFAAGLDVIAYDRGHAEIAVVANARYGKGNGAGGQLNLLDLMVYAVAKARDEPLLFTGRDFATTDITVHPASRIS